MIYSGDSTGQDIVTMTDTLAGTDSTSYPIAKKTTFANQAMRTIWTWIFEAYGGWLYDDSNNTDLPEATTTLVQNQVDYTLPVDSSTLVGLEYRNSATSSWQKIWPVTLEQIQDRAGAESQFYNVPSNPLYYRPTANGFKLYPAFSGTSLASSLKVFFTRDISGFTTTDTTKVPGFDVEFHEAVPTFMALQYADINQLQGLKKDLRRKWSNKADGDYPDGYEQKLKKHYSQRFAQMFPPRMTVRDAVREYS